LISIERNLSTGLKLDFTVNGIMESFSEFALRRRSSELPLEAPLAEPQERMIVIL